VIFATVGSQAPFDRLIRAVDEWAGARPGFDVFAQIATSMYRPRHIAFTDFLDPVEFKRKLQAASVVVGHAGMGSIISALELGKPMVVMPRRGYLRETRNDHQVAAAERFSAQARILVAHDEHQFASRLDEAISLGDTAGIDAQASPRLIATIRTFLQHNSRITPPLGRGASSSY
jgi:UDP-N-acetylglucosamine transferase subunit ALG13